MLCLACRSDFSAVVEDLLGAKEELGTITNIPNMSRTLTYVYVVLLACLVLYCLQERVQRTCRRPTSAAVDKSKYS
jgi:hypothetical protein